MAYLLDTNVVIDLRDGEETVVRNVRALTQRPFISIVTRVELEGGLHRDARDVEARRARLMVILEGLSALPFDADAADVYGRILAATGYSRRKVLDRMIAAQALLHRLALVTRNPDDFADVPGLDLLAW